MSALCGIIEHMFEREAAASAPGGVATASLAVRDLAARLGAIDATPAVASPAAGVQLSDSERIDLLRALEELKAAAAAAQAQLTTQFVASQRRSQATAGLTRSEIGRGITAQVALARRESPARARRYVGWAEILVKELPCTLAELRAGRTTEWRAQLVARETGWLALEHRAQVDVELAPMLERLGDRQVEAAAKRLAYRLDPEGYVARQRNAEGDRRVTLRPAPDTMTYLTGLLPVPQGVAVLAALQRHADGLRATGDDRSRGQIMADTLVERVTGASSPTAVGVEVQVVMTDQSLLGHGEHRNEPAEILGFGPVPVALARRLVGQAAAASSAWVRRFYTSPSSGELAVMDRQRRFFDDDLAQFLLVRDRVCRMPWCGAPIRHSDHVVPAAEGGATSADNGQGLCEACNQAKAAPGWRAEVEASEAPTEVVTITPTGHVYRSRAPDPPRTGSRCQTSAHP